MRMDILQSLWLGKRLSVMEQLCIRSFLDQGYSFHLYTYQEVENIPQGTTVCQGEEILPADEIFRYRRGYGKGSYSAFSNCFRYKLLLERGGWWADLDVVCTRSLDFSDDHVVGYERVPDGSRRIGTAMIKAPAGQPAHCVLLGGMPESRSLADRLGPNRAAAYDGSGWCGGRAGADIGSGCLLSHRLLERVAAYFGRASSTRLLRDPPVELTVAARAAGPRRRLRPDVHLRTAQAAIRDGLATRRGPGAGVAKPCAALVAAVEIASA